MTRPPVLAAVALLLVLAGCRGAGDPVVDGAALEAGADPEPTRTAEGQGPQDAEATPSPTAAAAGGDVDDAATDEQTDEPTPTAADACAGRDDEAFIEVLQPRPGDVVTDPITVTGCGNTFEAGYVYRLEGGGAVLAEDVGTMSCGNGCVGEFSFTLEAGTAGEVLLTVFEVSAQDGTRQHVVEVPLVVE